MSRFRDVTGTFDRERSECQTSAMRIEMKKFEKCDALRGEESAEEVRKRAGDISDFKR